MKEINTLVISHLIEGNRVFEDYYNGIKTHSRSCYFLDYIASYVANGKKNFEKNIEEILVDKEIDYIFFIWCSCDLTFDYTFIKKLASRVGIVINYFDTEYYFEGVDRYYAQMADLILLPDCLARYKYQQLDINVLTTFAMYDKNFYARNIDTEKTIDVSFIGNLKQSNRKEYIDFLKLNGILVQTFGLGSENGFVSFSEMVSIFNRSKINLNFTSISDSKNYVIEPPRINQRIRQSKGRPIEIALSGGFVLTEYAPGIEEMFLIGEEVDIFHTKEELLEKIKYYLLNERKKNTMAAKGYEKALKSYDSVAGFESVFNKMNDIGKSQNKTAYVDHAFLENFVSFRFFYILLFFLQGRLKNMIEELRVVFRYRVINFKKCFYFAGRAFLFYLRDYPNLESRLKVFKNKLGIQVKY